MDAMPTAIRCGTFIDGTGADPVRGATLVFEGNTITSIDPSGHVPRDAEVVDAGHLTVMPGMIDCHVHLSTSTWGVQERLLMPYSLLIAHALNHARVSLEAGFTSVRDAAGTPRGVRMAIEQGLFPGPRVRIAVSALSQTGGHGDATMPNGANIRPTNSEMPHTVVDGIEGVRRASREVLRAGADQIKVPFLILAGTADPLIDPDGSRQLHDKTVSTSTLRLLEGRYHEPFNDRGSEEVFKLIADWVNKR